MSRTLIVIKPEMVDATNQAIAEATGNPDDIYTFTVQLLNDKEFEIQATPLQSM